MKPEGVSMDTQLNEMEATAKKLMQEKHRLQMAENRDRVKERKERTRRLIQRGAILEKALDMAGVDIKYMTNEDLQDYLIDHLGSQKR